MNITQEPNGNLNAIIQVNIVESDYTGQVDKQLADYRRTANVPGFRQGKVPMGMIRKKYGLALLVDVVNKTVSDALNQYILDNKIPALGYPLANMDKTQAIDFENQKDFDFYFDIGLAPEFTVDLSSDIKVPYYTLEIEEKEIGNAIEDIKVRFGSETNPETSEAGDAIQGTLSRLNDEGQKVDEEDAVSTYLKVSDIKKAKDQKKYIGLKADDTVTIQLMKEIDDEAKVKSLLSLGEEDHEAMEATYELKVEKIVRPEDAVLGEELYEKIFPGKEIKSEEDFRAAIKVDMQKQTERDSDQQFLNDAVSKVIELAAIELPDEFLKRWLLESNQGKITQEQIDEQYESYARSFRWQMIEEKLREQFEDKLNVTNEEIRGRVANYFQAYGGGAELTPQIEAIIDQVLSNNDERKRIHDELIDAKFIALFKEMLSLDKSEVSRDKFIEIASQIK